MANGHGGPRPGAGRKPKSSYLRALDGGAGKRPLREMPVSAPPVPVEEFDAPDVLSPEQRNVWMEIAPHAFAARTLTKGTMGAFVTLCRNIVIEQTLASGALAGGPDHRGMIQRVQADRSAFALRPTGKALYQAEADAAKPAGSLSRFTSRKRA